MPYGPSYIEYADPNHEFYSFKGVGVFDQGRLHMGPFSAICGDNYQRSYTLMINGRLADSHYSTTFFGPGTTRNLESLKTLTEVGGM